MGNEKPPEKIGIGPTGRWGGLIPFIVFTIVGLLIFVYCISPVSIVLKIIPATLIMLIALGHLVLLGDNWPWAPPGGNWTPAKSRLIPGVGMTVLWAIFTFAMLLFMRFIYPGWPIGPLYLWFGVIGFWATLLYGVVWGGWPFKGKLHPWGTMAISFIIVMVVSILIWNLLTNLDKIPPLANTPINHKGPLDVEWLTGFLVWSIAWFFVFSPVFTTQGWPFGKSGHPGAAIGQTILAHILGYIFWSGTLALGISPTFSFAALGSSLIFWSLVHSWHLQFWGVTKYTHFNRAILAFIFQCIIIAIWIIILRWLLCSAANAIAAAKLPADVNILIIYLNLCIVAPALIAHNAFWLRWPLTLPTPPGTPPPDQSA